MLAMTRSGTSGYCAACRSRAPILASTHPLPRCLPEPRMVSQNERLLISLWSLTPGFWMVSCHQRNSHSPPLFGTRQNCSRSFSA